MITFIRFSCRTQALAVFAYLASVVIAADPIEGYVPLHQAISTTIQAPMSNSDGLSGYVGLAVDMKDGAIVVSDVAPESAAARGGVVKGDRVKDIDGVMLKAAADLRGVIQGKSPGDKIKVGIRRGGENKMLTLTVEALSHPRKLGDKAVLGVRTGAPSSEVGVDIVSVVDKKPAALAGLRIGDRILKIDDEEIGEEKSLVDALSERRAGDVIKISYRRAGKVSQKDVTLVGDDMDGSLPPEEQRILKNIWKKNSFRIAVICVEFSDVKHNEKIPLKEWEEAYFSRGTYTKKNATGQQVYGSMADYYQEVSCGKMSVEGKVFDWVEAKKKKVEYNVANKGKFKTDFFTELVQEIEKAHGENALKDFDGLAFIYSGPRLADMQRNSILWPHRSTVKIGSKTWPYVIVAEGGEQMESISVMCHEFGHILGLPDLYARPENPGSEGVGVWSVMSNVVRNGRPQHFCAWSKEQLGWVTPVVLDPTVKQKIILGPINGSATECAKVLVKPDGSEYFLLENRRKIGFDSSLPNEGLLIWRVVANRPILEESHGVEGPSGPRVFLSSVPWPTKYNSSFTPYTTPSSRSQLGGGLAVFITNIRQMADGRVSFEIGTEYQ